MTFRHSPSSVKLCSIMLQPFQTTVTVLLSCSRVLWRPAYSADSIVLIFLCPIYAWPLLALSCWGHILLTSEPVISFLHDVSIRAETLLLEKTFSSSGCVQVSWIMELQGFRQTVFKTSSAWSINDLLLPPLLGCRPYMAAASIWLWPRCGCCKEEPLAMVKHSFRTCTAQNLMNLKLMAVGLLVAAHKVHILFI